MKYDLMVMNRIKKYKEENFGSWLEFVLTFGVCKFEDGGFLLTVYGWGGILAIGGAVAHLLADYADRGRYKRICLKNARLHE
jgi:hypothetical protein